jgi:hypothetical protein
MPDDVISPSPARIGRWRGDGRRYGGAAFEAEMELKPVLGGRGVSLTYVAREDGTVIHHEEALVAARPEGGRRCGPSHTNTDGVWQQRYRGERATGDGGTAYLFGVGDVGNGATLRTEISLELFGDERSATGGSSASRAAISSNGHERAPAARRRSTCGTSRSPCRTCRCRSRSGCGRLGFSLLGRAEYEDKRQAFVGMRTRRVRRRAVRAARRGGGTPAEASRPHRVRVRGPRGVPDRDRESEPVRTFDNRVRYLRVADPDGVELEFFQGHAIFEREAERSRTS